MLEFLKQQEKQRKEYLKQQEIKRQKDLKQRHENIERQEENFVKLLECFSKQNDTGNLNILSLESVISSVREFIYKPEKVTFEAYFRRYESILGKDCEEQPHEKKMRILLGKFKTEKHKKYVNFILPRQPGEVTFRETIQILTKIFEEQSSLFNTRW